MDYKGGLSTIIIASSYLIHDKTLFRLQILTKTEMVPMHDHLIIRKPKFQFDSTRKSKITSGINIEIETMGDNVPNGHFYS